MENILKRTWNTITKSAKQFHVEQQHTSTNTKEAHSDNSSTKISLNEAIPDTPFRLIGDPDNGYFIAIGNYRITETQKTPAGAEYMIHKEPWIITANLIAAMLQADKTMQLQKLQEKQQ